MEAGLSLSCCRAHRNCGSERLFCDQRQTAHEKKRRRLPMTQWLGGMASQARILKLPRRFASPPWQDECANMLQTGSAEQGRWITRWNVGLRGDPTSFCAIVVNRLRAAREVGPWCEITTMLRITRCSSCVFKSRESSMLVCCADSRIGHTPCA